MFKSVIGAVALLLASSAAFAADVYQPEPAPAEPAYQPVEVSSASGWYLRGDTGWAWKKSRGATFYQGGSSSDEAEFTTASLRSGFTLGAGVGYQINNYLRSDVTFDYMFRSDFEGSTRGSGAAFGACVGPCTSRDLASMAGYSLLANAYVDFGTWASITPYAGAGIGGTYVKWSDLSNTSCEDGNPANCDDTVTHRGRGNWRLSWALMAGASVDVTCNLKADVGYRFRRVEGGRMFDFAENGGPGYDRGFNSHEGRVGLRYVFSGCDQQAYVPPADIPYQPVYK